MQYEGILDRSSQEFSFSNISQEDAEKKALEQFAKQFPNADYEWWVADNTQRNDDNGFDVTIDRCSIHLACDADSEDDAKAKVESQFRQFYQHSNYEWWVAETNLA